MNRLKFNQMFTHDIPPFSKTPINKANPFIPYDPAGVTSCEGEDGRKMGTSPLFIEDSGSFGDFRAKDIWVHYWPFWTEKFAKCLPIGKGMGKMGKHFGENGDEQKREKTRIET